DEVGRGDDDPEQVDLELRLLGRRLGDLAQGLPNDGEGVHGRHRLLGQPAAGLMKIASRATTTARTPRPSANAARMIARPRISPAASGLRPIAAAASPARIPIPMPGPITPRAARAPRFSMFRVPSVSRVVPGLGPLLWVVSGPPLRRRGWWIRRTRPPCSPRRDPRSRPA